MTAPAASRVAIAITKALLVAIATGLLVGLATLAIGRMFGIWIPVPAQVGLIAGFAGVYSARVLQSALAESRQRSEGEKQ